MKTSINGIDLIKSFESLHDGDLSKIGLQPKMDPIGIWTEGWGRVMRMNNGHFLRGSYNRENAEKFATVHTVAQADAALMDDLKVFEAIVMKKVTTPLRQREFDALVSHAYNTGGSSTLFKLTNKNAPAAEIRKWWVTTYITADGVKLNGLVRRRNAEADMFFGEGFDSAQPDIGAKKKVFGAWVNEVRKTSIDNSNNGLFETPEAVEYNDGMLYGISKALDKVNEIF